MTSVCASERASSATTRRRSCPCALSMRGSEPRSTESRPKRQVQIAHATSERSNTATVPSRLTTTNAHLAAAHSDIDSTPIRKLPTAVPPARAWPIR